MSSSACVSIWRRNSILEFDTLRLCSCRGMSVIYSDSATFLGLKTWLACVYTSLWWINTILYRPRTDFMLYRMSWLSRPNDGAEFCGWLSRQDCLTFQTRLSYFPNKRVWLSRHGILIQGSLTPPASGQGCVPESNSFLFIEKVSFVAGGWPTLGVHLIVKWLQYMFFIFD